MFNRSSTALFHITFCRLALLPQNLIRNTKINNMKNDNLKTESNNANVLLSAVWVGWMTTYPKKNGLYLITPRGKTETWVGYWNDVMRRFEEAVPEFTEKGIDVDWWAEMPINPNCR